MLCREEQGVKVQQVFIILYPEVWIEKIFSVKNAKKTRFLNLLKDNLNECNVEIYAYCVMSNHFHLLVKVEKEIMPIFMAKCWEDMRNIIIINIIVLVMYLKIDIIRSA